MNQLKNIVMITLLALSASRLNAQEKLLFTYGGDTVYTDEFLRIFNKNNAISKNSSREEAIKEYLDLYINFKLKVKQARELGMDTTAAFRAEFKGYRDQLAQNYLKDTTALQRLIDEAYERMQYEINASHILLFAQPFEKPSDTLMKWNRLKSIRDKAVKKGGERFDTLAARNSEDPSAVQNKGELGYFSAFQMIYPFENAAYNTAVGDVSMPFRTRYGFHLIKVNDKRKSRGSLKLAHIMLRFNENMTPEEKNAMKVKLDSIYSRIAGGTATWEAMVEEFSEDEGSKIRGGEMNIISGTSGLPKDFLETAFALQNPGDVSKPVQTPFGWHLIRLLEKIPMKTKDELSEEIKQKINRDERGNLSREMLIKQLEKEYKPIVNKAAITEVARLADTTLSAGTWEGPASGVFNKPVITIRERVITQQQFIDYLMSSQTEQPGANPQMLAEGMFLDFYNQQVYQYGDDDLENRYPEFKSLTDEYYEGILLFNVSEKMVWGKSVEDTTALKDFYETIKQKYRWNERLEVKLYECENAEVGAQVLKLLKKKAADTTISKEVAKTNPLGLAIKSGKYEKGANVTVDRLQWKKGREIIPDMNGKYVIAEKIKIWPAEYKKLSEARGPVTTEFQAKLEKDWINNLRQRYPVQVNDAAVQSLIKN